MAKLALTLAHSLNDRSRPVLEGAVKPDGIDFQPTVASPPDIFWLQLEKQQFDVSEMSLSSLLIAVARGNRDWVGLPIFTSRHFFQTWAWVRTDAGIERPEDLKGKRVGVPEYQQTAALWTRGILEHDFGVRPTEMEWFMERTPERSHGGATGFQPPAGLRFHYIPPETNIGAMMMQGELDATLLYIRSQSLVDRSQVPFENNPRVRPLFPDPAAEGQRYYRNTGIFPINHAMVLRRSIYERHPWVALNVFNAYRLAKEQVSARMRELLTTHLELGLLPEQAGPALRVDAYPYGVKSNQALLETAARYSHEQGLTPRVVQMNEVFAPSTLDL
jgi:4,5-dihydroxyphthalate decarboxylase